NWSTGTVFHYPWLHLRGGGLVQIASHVRNVDHGQLVTRYERLVVAKYASIHASDVSYLYPLCAGGQEPPLLSPYHDLVTSIPGAVREPIRLGSLGFLIGHLV